MEGKLPSLYQPSRRATRRRVLVAGGTGLAGAALAACGPLAPTQPAA